MKRSKCENERCNNTVEISEKPGAGRPRKYCSKACRKEVSQRNKEAKKAKDEEEAIKKLHILWQKFPPEVSIRFEQMLATCRLYPTICATNIFVFFIDKFGSKD